MPYAANTNVTVDRSQQEIRKILRDHNADHIGFMEQKSPPRALIAFSLEGIPVQITVPMPDPDSEAYKWTNHKTPRKRDQAQRRAAADQDERSQWRAAALWLRAKFAAVDAGIRTLEQEMFADIVMKDGQSAYESIMPRLRKDGGMAPMQALPGGSA